MSGAGGPSTAPPRETPVTTSASSDNLTTSLQNDRNRFLHGMTSPLRIAGLLISVISLHLFVVRPLVDRVDVLEAELQNVDRSLSEVAGYEESLSANNDLLSELKRQHEDLAAARATVRQLQQLRLEILKEADRIPEAMAAVTRISALPDHVLTSEAELQSQLQSTPDIDVPEPKLESPPPRFPLLAQSAFETAEANQPARPLPIQIKKQIRLIQLMDDAGDNVESWQIAIQPRQD